MKELWQDVESKYATLFKEQQLTSVSSQELGASQESLPDLKYRIMPVIAKANDDLRQEVMAMQLMRRVKGVFEGRGETGLWLRPYEIMVTSGSAGFIEFIPDTISVDQLKKKFPRDAGWTLLTYYEKRYGDLHFKEAQINFIQSLAAYSLFNYLFNVKDRHNGNILLDAEGHLLHIDFGFMLQSSPGNFNFETAPFKLTQEYLQLMDQPSYAEDGRMVDSQEYQYFKSLIVKGLLILYECFESEGISNIIEVMLLLRGGTMPSLGLQYAGDMPDCIKNSQTVLSEIRTRLTAPKLSQYLKAPGANQNEAKYRAYIEYVELLIKKSTSSWATSNYDRYQAITNGIEK
ncbi:hypothetical protein FGO68_gene10323 [Halteria grandinella]|uniref:PI3K/PI4K catalytic domain-containing protein n=1 Tax=Halteria grandinella TaxID=5974 RepID=A0A8J8NXQ1_HALGN|nr:hypothetical protein FGO68_gene10323 [Halteria grandinella]